MMRSVLVAIGLALYSIPVSAQGLGLSLDDLLEKITATATAEGTKLDVKKVGCAENPKPGDETKKIISCSHTFGEGKVLITNADPSGPLLDISTQMWPEKDAGRVIGWIASALNSTPGTELDAATAKLVADAKANNTSSGTFGKGEFFVLSMGENFVVSVSAP